jgi:TP901 family phage tail tape measure protein
LADDVNANINVNFDTKDALRSLRQLQAGLSRFNQALTQGNVAAANAQKGLTDQLIQSINATGKFVASQKEISTSTRQFTDALEKNKLSLREYWRYTAATATQNTKVFSKAWAAEREVITRAAKDRVKLLQSQYIQLNNANGEFVKVLQIVPKHLRTVNGEITDYATRVQLTAQRQQFLNQLIKQGSTQLLNWGKNTQWAGRQLMVGLTIPLTMLGSTASRVFMDMEMALLKFQKVYGDTVTNATATNAAVEDLKRLALEFTKWGVSVKDTIEMASTAAAMGLTGEALKQQVTSATKLAVLGQVEQQQALETTISLQNAFGLSTDQLAQKINFLNAVENQTVLSIEDLTIAIPKAGPVVKQLGGSVEDLAFFLTAMKEGGINASEGANALKSGLASLINPSKKASEMLAGLGVNITGIVEANAGDLKGTVVGFARALDELDPLNRARAIEQLFGKFQFARLSTLFQNVAKDGTQAARAFQLAGASVEELAILSERELSKTENAVTNKFKKSIEQLKVSLVPVGKAFLEALTPVVQFVGKILDKFNNLSDGTKKIITTITIALGAIAPVVLMSVGLVANGIANLMKFFAMLRGGVAKLNGQNQVLGGGFDYLTQQEIENLAETNALHTSHQQLIATFNVEKGAVDALAAAYGNAGSQARALAASAPGLFNTVPGASGAVTGLPTKKFAEGGVVPGTGNKDTVPAMLTPGEVVLTKDEVKNNPELIAAIQNGAVKKYHEGGTVGASSQSAGRSSAGNLPAWLQKEYSRIDSLEENHLRRYAELMGLGVDKSLEEIRTAVRENFDLIIADVKQQFGKLTEEGLKAVGKKYNPEKGYSPMGAYYEKFDQNYGKQFSHVGQTDTMPIGQVKNFNLNPQALKGLEILEKLNINNPNIRVADAFGMDIMGGVNRGMESKGAAKAYEKRFGAGSLTKDLIGTFEETGINKWRTMTKLVGADFDALSGQIQIYDDALLAKIKAWQVENSQKQIPDLMTDDIFRALEEEVRRDISGLIPDFQQVIQVAKQKITALRVSLTKDELSRANAEAQAQGLGKNFYGTKTGNAKVDNIEARKAGEILGTKTVEGVNEGAATQSPSKKTKKTGQDIADGLIVGMKSKEQEVKQEAVKLADDAVAAAQAADVKRAENVTSISGVSTTQMREKQRQFNSMSKEEQDALLLQRTGGRKATSKTDLEEIAIQKSIDRNRRKVQEELLRKEKEELRLQEAAVENARKQAALAEERLIADKQSKRLSESDALDIANTFVRDENGQIIMDQNGPMTKKKYKAMKRGMRREAVGRVSGKMAGGLGMATVAAGMLGAPPQVTAALGSASMIAQFAPMLAGMSSMALAGGAIAALAIGAKVLNDKFTKAAEATADFVKRTSITTSLMKKLGEQQGTVGASEIMSKRRGGSPFDLYNESARKGTDKGEKFLSGEAGQAMQKSFSEAAKKQGMEVAAQEFATQLAGAVSDGVISGQLASDIAYQLGVNLKDSNITVQVDGYLRSLVGRDGEDLTKDPLAVRTRIANLAGARSQDALAKIKSGDTGGRNAFWQQVGSLGLAGERSGSDLAAQFAASSANAIEVAQMQADAMQVYYEKELKALQVQKAATTDKQKQLEIDGKITALLDQQIAGMQRMNSLVAARLEQATQQFDESINTGFKGGVFWDDASRRQDAYFDALKGNIKGQYKGTAFEGSAQQALNTLARSDEDKTLGIQAGRTFEAKMQLIMNSGQMNPDQVNTILDMFKGNLKEADALINLGMRTVGGQKTAELVNMFKGFSNKKDAQFKVGAILRLSKSNPKGFDQVSNALALLKASDGLEIDMEAYINTIGLPGLYALSNKLQEVEKLKSPITKEVITKFGQDNNVDVTGLINNWDYYSKMPPEVQKEAIQTYTALYDNLIHFENEDARRAWATKQAELEALGAGAKGSKEYETVYNTRFAYYTEGTLNDPTKAAQMANQQVQAKYGTIETILANKAKGDAANTGKGTNPLAFLDDLAQKFKNVRDGAFNAMTPLKSILALFNNKTKKDIGAVVKMFDGLQQRLIKLNVPKEFRDYIAGLSNEDFAKLANLKGDKQLFTFAKDKKGKELPRTKANITGLTNTGNAVMNFYRDTILGEAQVTKKETVKDIQNQNQAFNMLVASGMSADRALKEVENTAVAAAIAMGAAGKAGSSEMKQFIKDTNAATDAAKKKAVIDNMIQKNEEFRIQQTLPQLASALKGLGYSTDQISEVLTDPELAQQLTDDLKDGKIDAKEIADYINSIPAKKIIEIQTNINKGDYAEAAAQGRDFVDQLFQAQENLIRTGADPRSTALVDEFKKNESAIKDKTKQADALRKQIDGLQKEITKIQRNIEETFNKPIEAMQKQIDVNQRALEVGGAYKINGKEMALPYKLSNRYMEELNAESNKLSNDLTVIAHQSDAINEKYDKQVESLQKVKEINDQIAQQQKDQLDLADALTQGDIAAAARSAQQSRANMASTYADQQMQALEQSRQNDLAALTGPESGLTQAQIQERQYQIQQELYKIETSPERLAIKAEQTRLEDEIYKLEQLRQVELDKIAKLEKDIYDIQVNKLEPLEEEITKLEEANTKIQEQIDKMVEAIRVQGMSRDEWERIKAKIDASALASKNMDAALAGLLAATQAINSEWASILAKLDSYKSVSSTIQSQADSFTNTAAADKAAADKAAADKAAADKAAADKAAALNNYGKAVVSGNMDLAATYATQVNPSKIASQESGAIGAASIAAQLKAAENAARLAASQQIIADRKAKYGYISKGGLVPKYFTKGGIARGTDTVPAMLTPGEFIMSRYAVDSYGLKTMKAINNGDSVGDSVYNYSINVNVKSDANPEEIAQAVMTQINRVNSQTLRSVRI